MRIPAAVTQAGSGRIPLPVLKNMKKVMASFKQDRLRVRIEDTKLRIQTFGFTHPDIELKKSGVRAVDLPMDAAVIDVLALMKLFSAEELGESGLAARVMEAQERAIQSIDSAHSYLKVWFYNQRAGAENLISAPAVCRISTAIGPGWSRPLHSWQSSTFPPFCFTRPATHCTPASVKPEVLAHRPAATGGQSLRVQGLHARSVPAVDGQEAAGRTGHGGQVCL
jgi:hypothetical protein